MADTFGKTDVGGTIVNAFGMVKGWRGNVATGGVITKISVYCHWSTNVRVAVYNGSDPATATLLWESASVAHGASSDWEHIVVPNKSFNAGGMSLALQHETNNSRVARDAAVGGGHHQVHAYGVFDDPLNSVNEDFSFSIYATYTPSGGQQLFTLINEMGY